MSFLNFNTSDNLCIIPTTTNEKILGFLGLPQGWHYGEGNSPSEETITKSVQINQ